jgi:hypothetical protein
MASHKLVLELEVGSDRRAVVCPCGWSKEVGFLEYRNEEVIVSVLKLAWDRHMEEVLAKPHRT